MPECVWGSMEAVLVISLVLVGIVTWAVIAFFRAAERAGQREAAIRAAAAEEARSIYTQALGHLAANPKDPRVRSIVVNAGRNYYQYSVFFAAGVEAKIQSDIEAVTGHLKVSES